MLSWAGVGFSLSGCGSDDYAWNQKLTLVVQTPQGEKSGSAVVGIKAAYRNMIDAGPTAEIQMQGEATVVDLGGGKYLFALLGEQTKYMADSTFNDKLPNPRTAIETFSKLSGMKGEKADVPGTVAPMLVMFKNLKDPASVEQVRSLASVGSGYSLKSMTLEITDEPVTQGVVEKVLPWATTMQGSIGKGKKLPYSHLLNQINNGSFKQRFLK